MVFSGKEGAVIVGEKLVGESRKIFEFKNSNPILERNKSSAKIQSHGGVTAMCYIDKTLRESKIDSTTKIKIKIKIKEFIENIGCEFQFPLDTINDYIKGDQIICECQSCQKDKQNQKISMSGRHSGMRYFFFGDCCIAFLDRAFRHIRDIKLKN